MRNLSTTAEDYIRTWNHKYNTNTNTLLVKTLHSKCMEPNIKYNYIQMIYNIYISKKNNNDKKKKKKIVHCVL